MEKENSTVNLTLSGLAISDNYQKRFNFAKKKIF